MLKSKSAEVKITINPSEAKTKAPLSFGKEAIDPASFGDIKWVMEHGWAGAYVSQDGTDTTATIYHGQVVQCDLTAGPPNVTVRIKCYTHQVDKTQFIEQPPPFEETFKQLVVWAGNQCGFDNDHVICNTSHDGDIVDNFARSKTTAGELPTYIEQFYWPSVAAYIDDNLFIVKDMYAVLNPTQNVAINDFIGIPTWTEWGVEFTTLLDLNIRLAQSCTLTSSLNPSLNGQYVVMTIDYELHSRDTPFYCHVQASPPA